MYTEVPSGDSMCYVYHEQEQRFLAWGPILCFIFTEMKTESLLK